MCSEPKTSRALSDRSEDKLFNLIAIGSVCSLLSSFCSLFSS